MVFFSIIYKKKKKKKRIKKIEKIENEQVMSFSNASVFQWAP